MSIQFPLYPGKIGYPDRTPYFSPRYWEDPRIHTLGNSGVLGALHAGMAPLFTGMIDVLAHDMRQPGGVRASLAFLLTFGELLENFEGLVLVCIEAEFKACHRVYSEMVRVDCSSRYPRLDALVSSCDLLDAAEVPQKFRNVLDIPNFY